MKIIGIDPGTRILGYGIVYHRGNLLTPVAYGAINTKSTDPIEQKLHIIYHSLTNVFEKYQPDIVAIEKVFYGKNVQSAIKIGEARGVALLAAANANLPVHEYEPTKIKKAVTGVGNAHKSQIQKMVQTILALSEMPKPADAADALAIAICHCNSLVVTK